MLTKIRSFFSEKYEQFINWTAVKIFLGFCHAVPFLAGIAIGYLFQPAIKLALDLGFDFTHLFIKFLHTLIA